MHDFFKLGIIFKSLTGLWELMSGLIFFVASKETLQNWFYLATQNELLEDPNDHLINFLSKLFGNVSANAQKFAAYYLLIHGVLNILLSYQLFKNRTWAYPAAIAFLAIFMFYQTYRIFLNHSLFLTFITIFDVFFLILLISEYRIIRHKTN